MTQTNSTQTSDLLDEMLARRTDQNPEFPAIYEATLQTRKMIDQLATNRRLVPITDK